MQRTFILFLLLTTVAPHCGLADTEALRLIEEARIAAAGGRDVVPRRIEINAVYRYEDENQAISDLTVIEPGQSLFQERQIEGEPIRRSWSVDGGYLESPAGRVDLDPDMRVEPETYLCRRQLEFLILYPGAEASVLRESTSSRRMIEVRRGEVLLGVLEIDLETRRLAALQLPLDATLERPAAAAATDASPTDASPTDTSATDTSIMDTVAKVTFSDFRMVDG